MTIDTTPATRRAFSVSVYAQAFTRAPVPSSKVLLVKHKRHDLWLPLGGELQWHRPHLSYKQCSEDAKVHVSHDGLVFDWCERHAAQPICGVPSARMDLRRCPPEKGP